MATAAPGAVVEGFANNVPLAVALQQVLPAGYGFSIDQDVDLGTLVSFQGGRPWRETLEAMLRPANLTVREQGPMVVISHVRMASNTATPVMPLSVPSSVPANAAVANAPPVPLWPGAKINGPKPILAQPNVAPLPPSQPSPLVSSLRVTPAPVVDTWTAARGDTLHKVLKDWSQRAGAEFEWTAEYDYPLQASISFTGTFEEAVRNLLMGFEEAHPQPVAELHANPGAGQMVLVIQTRGNSYTD